MSSSSSSCECSPPAGDEVIPLDYRALLLGSDPGALLEMECQRRQVDVSRSTSFSTRLQSACELSELQKSQLAAMLGAQACQKAGMDSSSLLSSLRGAAAPLSPDGSAGRQQRFGLMASHVVGTVMREVGDEVAVQIQEDEDLEEHDPDVAASTCGGAQSEDVLTSSFQSSSGLDGEVCVDQFRILNLHEFAFVANRITAWNVPELTAIFNAFDKLDSKANMVLLFETCGNASFKELPIIVRGYFNALLHRGCPAIVQEFLLQEFGLADKLASQPKSHDLVHLQMVLADPHRTLFGIHRELIRLRASLADERTGPVEQHRIRLSLSNLVQSCARATSMTEAQIDAFDFADLSSRVEHSFRQATEWYRGAF